MRALGLAIVAAAALGCGPAAAQDATMGEQLFSRCTVCHDTGAGAQNRVGPELNGIVGRRAGSLPGYGYSEALKQADIDGLIWTPEALAGYLASPRDFVHGVAMAFRGFKSDDDIADVVAYLETLKG